MGYRLATLTKQILDCEFVGIVLLDQTTSKLQLAEVVGLPYTIVEQIRRNASSSLNSYFSDETIAQFHANEVIRIELLPMPFRYKNMSGFRNMLIAPMVADGKLVGLLGLKKGPFTLLGDKYQYTEEERSLVKIVAKLALLFIERERFQHEWLQSSANELALRETNQHFDKFISIAGHELRTPLTTIKGNIQLAQRRLSKLETQPDSKIAMSGQQKEQIQASLLQAAHRVNVLQRMISDLLDVSRIQANKLAMELQLHNLIDIVQRAIADQLMTMPSRTILFHGPENPSISVICDDDRIGQVINNFLSNALKYSPPDALVEVAVQQDVEDVRISVRDYGPGISAEEQANLWQRFYRVKGIEPQGDSGTGLGLGLHISQTIIKQHHGTIGVESTPGEGSTFWFTLPLTSSESPDMRDGSM